MVRDSEDIHGSDAEYKRSNAEGDSRGIARVHIADDVEELLSRIALNSLMSLMNLVGHHAA
jgi:hypothetical protein